MRINDVRLLTGRRLDGRCVSCDRLKLGGRRLVDRSENLLRRSSWLFGGHGLMKAGRRLGGRCA